MKKTIMAMKPSGSVSGAMDVLTDEAAAGTHRKRKNRSAIKAAPVKKTMGEMMRAQMAQGINDDTNMDVDKEVCIEFHCRKFFMITIRDLSRDDCIKEFIKRK